MVVTQAVAAVSAAVLGGSAFTTARRGSGSENGAVSLFAAQLPGSARPCASPGLVSPFHRRLKACVGAQPIASASSVNGVTGDVRNATKVGVLPLVEEEKETETETVEQSTAEAVPEASISAFMADVSNLIKLVDSRDIFELELKHKEYEIVIRKEAPQPVPPPTTFPGPHVMGHTSFPGYAPPPPEALVPVSPPASTVAEPAPVVSTTPTPAQPSHPPMLSPMAGTFYRSPGPGESAFVQVGDKITKGQVVCIVEAMKLMNEIEADQSGTIVEILAEDGKPISIETPLFSIKP